MSDMANITAVSGFVITLVGMRAGQVVNKYVVGDSFQLTSPDDRIHEKYKQLIKDGKAPKWPLMVTRICIPLGFMICLFGVFFVDRFLGA